MEETFVAFWNSMFDVNQLLKDSLIYSGLTGITLGVFKKLFN